MKNLIMGVLCIAVVCFSCQGNKSKSSEPQTADAENLIEGVQSFEFDDFVLTTIQDRESEMDNSLFENADKDVLAKLSPNGKAESAINVFLVEKDGKRILFDSGLGRDKGGMMLEKLKELGLTADSIDAVCLTHFHGDHIGGMVAEGKAVFANADVYASEKECAAWKLDNEQVKNMIIAYDSCFHQVQFGDTILGNIVVLNAVGHTPGHTIYEIENVLVVGDLLHAVSIQVPHPEYCARYDQNLDDAIKTRKYFFQYAKENHKWLAGMHFPMPGVIQNFGEDAQ